jgi:hypothetical protein
MMTNRQTASEIEAKADLKYFALSAICRFVETTPTLATSIIPSCITFAFAQIDEASSPAGASMPPPVLINALSFFRVLSSTVPAQVYRFALYH